MIEWVKLAQGVGAFLIFLGVVAAAVAIVTSRTGKQNQEELENLAETRGKVIDDLRDNVATLNEQVAELMVKVKYLEEREIEKIIKGVVDGVVRELK